MNTISYSAGTYNIANTIISNAPTHYIGAGRDLTILRKSTSNDLFNVNNDTIFENLTFDGNNGNSGYIIANTTNNINVQILNCRFSNLSDRGITSGSDGTNEYVYQSTDIENTEFINSQARQTCCGWFVSGRHQNLTINRCYFKNAYSDVLDANGNVFTFTNNNCETSGLGYGYGGLQSVHKNQTITDNIFTNMNSKAICVGGDDFSTNSIIANILRNTINKTTYQEGIRLQNLNNPSITIQYNNISNAETCAIATVFGCTTGSIIITDNTLCGSRSCGSSDGKGQLYNTIPNSTILNNSQSQNCQQCPNIVCQMSIV